MLGEQQLHLLPNEDKIFFLRILNHTNVVDDLFISRISGTEERYTADNTVETPTLADLRDNITKNDTWFVDFTQSMSVDELHRQFTFQFTDGDYGQLSVEEALMHLLTHGSNHRGMASKVLAANNLVRPRDTFTRYLHELEPERRQIE
ncbi:damage-inducible protein DinB [Marinomonas agarivorans]|nr:damage-inducible protein DinB [Marinomonas agarivorans]